MIGDEVNLETMDYSTKTLREPTMSLIIPKLQKMGHVAIVVNWLKIKEEFVAENTASNWMFLIGPVWDYQNNFPFLNQLLSWFEKYKSKVVNNVFLIKWNMNKRYLRDVSEAGLVIPKTLFIETPTKLVWKDIEKDCTSKDIVLKPFIDGCGENFKHLKLAQEKAEQNAKYFEELKNLNRGILVQEFIKDVLVKGEIGFIFFSGEYQYCILKVPAIGEDRVHEEYGGLFLVVRQDAEFDLAQKKVLDQFRADFQLTKEEFLKAKEIAIDYMKKFEKLLAKMKQEFPKYIRVDGIFSENKFYIMELELFEPYLNLGGAIEGDKTEQFLTNYINAILN